MELASDPRDDMLKHGNLLHLALCQILIDVPEVKQVNIADIVDIFLMRMNGLLYKNR